MVTNCSCACATPLRLVPANAAEKIHAKDLPFMDALLLVVFWILERLLSAREFWSLAGQTPASAPPFTRSQSIRGADAMHGCGTVARLLSIDTKGKMPSVSLKAKAALPLRTQRA